MDRYLVRTDDDHNYSDWDRADAQYPPPQPLDQRVLPRLDHDEKWKRGILKVRLHMQVSHLCEPLRGGL